MKLTRHMFARQASSPARNPAAVNPKGTLTVGFVMRLLHDIMIETFTTKRPIFIMVLSFTYTIKCHD